MDTLVQWELFDQGGVGLSTDELIAGRGAMFLIVDDVTAERRRLQGLGIVLEADGAGDADEVAASGPAGGVTMLRTRISGTTAL